MRLIGTVAALCALTTVLAACTSSGNAPTTGGSGSASGSGSSSRSQSSNLATDATFTPALDSDPGNLHPQGSAASNTFQVTQFAYDNLVNEDSKGKIMSGLATRWQVQ